MTQARLVRLPRDADGFIRRQCPACERTFKTRPLPSDAFAIHAYVCAQAPQVNQEELCAELPLLTCLYCGFDAPAHRWLTAEQQLFLEELGDGLGAHVRYEQLAFVGRNLRDNPRPTYVAVPPSPLVTEMEPELDDGEPIWLVCCGAEVKGVFRRREVAHCPRCGVAHRESAPKQEVHLPEASA